MVEEKNQIKFVCISDTHNVDFIHEIPDGDVLIHSGDFTKRGQQEEMEHFFKLLDSLPHKIKIVIAGNHDMCLDLENFEQTHKQNFFSDKQIDPQALKEQLQSKCTYLENESFNVHGYQLYGSPYTPIIESCKVTGFAKKRNEIHQIWDNIPNDTDILITHSPPYGILDKGHTGQNWGCQNLRKQVFERIKPIYHIFGHIHEYHDNIQIENINFINASSINIHKKQEHAPIVFYLPYKK